ncbi:MULTISPECIES: DNA repair protein RecN [Clostridia]|jgi:DNA repair protein RecN (Recombination protein N)|uniref:DNA repair protein RecN n=1 Tax=Clostridium sp. MCC345 TaxID=2592645 RepID=UPI000E8A21F1|nr:DNA repair protein RecN [Anaerotignum faecicola]MBT9766351.1 DNA repair protein RecN [Clostridium sp. MCC345]HBD88057.1 DNA repair protein RecN [Tyzzerella sp.]
MLEHLHIRNVALIKESEISFGDGLNILTGETGAGKSMIIDSLQFALGGRAGKDFLRHGEKQAAVEALFSVQSQALTEKLAENGIVPEEDGTLLITRTLSEAGKSVCRINGSTVTVGMLKEIAEDMIDIYGQHEHQSLLNPVKHIRLLDRFCGAGFGEAMEEYKNSRQRLKDLEKQLTILIGDESQREQRMDMLLFQKEEIEAAELQEGEEDALLEQKKRLSSMERLIRLTGESVTLLYDGDDRAPSACDQLGDALAKLREAAEYDAALSPLADALADGYAAVEDCARELKREAEKQEADPEELERIEERLQLFYKLKRKYGGSIEAVLEFYEKAVQELEFLSNSSEKAAELSAKKAAEEKRLSALAETLTARRRATAEQVEEQIETALHDMEMKHARFHIQIEEKADWGADGKDKVEFLISANAGEPLKPLAKIASGGEMSRVMLALKTVLVDADEIGTFIFDEIDTGVSGRTARRVGEKMRFLGGKRQLLCITHLPQIAAMADNHFLIEKESDAGETVTRVTALDEEGAVREVARLMNDVTETTLAAARELLAEK